MEDFQWLTALLKDFRAKAQELRDRLKLFEDGAFRMSVNNRDVTAETMESMKVNIAEFDDLIGQIEAKLAGK